MRRSLKEPSFARWHGASLVRCLFLLLRWGVEGGSVGGREWECRDGASSPVGGIFLRKKISLYIMDHGQQVCKIPVCVSVLTGSAVSNSL